MNILQNLKKQYKAGNLTLKLILINTLLFIIPTFLVGFLFLFKVNFYYYEWVFLKNDFSSLLVKPWTLISYSFFHNGTWHLILNMIMLHFSAHLFTTYFTQKQLLEVYVLGGLFGGILFISAYLFLPFLANQSTYLVGASASITAIIFATTTYQPYRKVNLIILGETTLWHLAIVFLIIDFLQLPLNNTGGHISHLGGALFGFIYIKCLQQGVDLGKGVQFILLPLTQWGAGKKNTPFKTIYRNTQTPPIPTTPTTRQIVKKDKTQQQIDEILDKISQSGYESLTKEEKDFLFQAGKKL